MISKPFATDKKKHIESLPLYLLFFFFLGDTNMGLGIFGEAIWASTEEMSDMVSNILKYKEDLDRKIRWKKLRVENGPPYQTWRM